MGITAKDIVDALVVRYSAELGWFTARIVIRKYICGSCRNGRALINGKDGSASVKPRSASTWLDGKHPMVGYNYAPVAL